MTKREGALPRGQAFPSKPRKKGIPKAKGRTGRNSSSMTRALTGDNKINTNPGKRENVAISQISSAGSYSHNLAQSRLQSCAECNLPPGAQRAHGWVTGRIINHILLKNITGYKNVIWTGLTSPSVFKAEFL